jgi:hypothetical protein
MRLLFALVIFGAGAAGFLAPHAARTNFQPRSLHTLARGPSYPVASSDSARLAVATMRGRHVVMQASPQELLAPDAWVESGAAALQKLPATCARLSSAAAEAEHLAIALLEEGGDRGMASKLLAASGVSPAAVRAAFEAFASKQPKVTRSDRDLTAAPTPRLLLDVLEGARMLRLCRCHRSLAC